MKATDDRPVATVLRLFRALAAAYPQEFRNVYGDAMERMAEDTVSPLWKEQGLWGAIRLLLNIALRIPAEYASEVRQDVKYGLRMLRASPGFTAVALLSLTLGIGVATSAFSEMNGFILRDVPGVMGADELVALKAPVSYETYKRYREHQELFSATLAYVAPAAFAVAVGGRPERTWGNLVTPSYFAALGARVALGRFFAEDDRDAVVVSYRLWQDRLGSDLSVVGKTLRINGHSCVVVGVGAEGFRGASPMVYGADVWIPIAGGEAIAPELADHALERPDRKIFHMVARLRPGVSVARAETALDAAARQLEQEHGDPDRDLKGRRAALGQGGKLLPLEKKDVPMLAGFFVVLGGLILLIAVSNVANMTLARAAGRRREIAMRLALGAARWRLIRQLVIEGMLPALASGALGFLVAIWLMRLASQQRLPYPMPLRYDLSPDGRVLIFCLGLTLFTGLAFGLLPALHATRTDLTPALKDGGNAPLGRHRKFSARNVLMTSQVAASLALLLITGFLVIGHRRMTSGDVGFDAERLATISLDPVRDGYSPQRTEEFFEKLTERVQRLPAVTAASLADAVPMTMIGKPSAAYAVPGDTGRTIHSARRYAVDRKFFATMGIPLVRGRDFRQEDEADGSLAAIVSEKLARECWKGQDPIGRRIEIGQDGIPSFGVGGNGPAMKRTNLGMTRTVSVVGVVKDVRDGLILAAADLPAIIYVPLQPADYARPPSRGMSLLIRGAPGVDAIAAVRREIGAIDDRITPFGARTLVDQIDEIMSAVRAAGWTYGCIGLFGLILASVGLAGVTAYTVTRRRREIGIRIAVGARGRDVLRLVMSEGLALVTIGSLAGLLGARVGIRVMGGILSEVARTAGTSTSDPALLIGAPLLLALVALVACYLPARASTRIDPVEALRQE